MKLEWSDNEIPKDEEEEDDVLEKISKTPQDDSTFRTIYTYSKATGSWIAWFNPALHLVRILLRVIIKTKAVSIQLTPALCSTTPKQAGLLGSTQNVPIVLANSTPQVCMRPRPRAHLIATLTGAEVQVGDLVESFPAIEPVCFQLNQRTMLPLPQDQPSLLWVMSLLKKTTV